MGKRPPVKCVVEPSSRRAGHISSSLSVHYRRRAHRPMRFLFLIFKICAIGALGSQKGRERGRKRGGHGLRDGSCEAGAAQSSWRGVAAARLRGSRAPAPAPRGESERKAARKPLKRPDSRKKEIWISLPLALIFLPNDLDFPSPGFANPSTHFVKSRLSTSLPLAFIERRAAGEAPLSPKGGARRSSRVNAVGWLPALRSFDGSSSPQFNATDEFGAPRTASRIALRPYCAIIARPSRYEPEVGCAS